MTSSFKLFVTLTLLLGFGAGSFAQNETSKWYFGNMAGLDFMTNPPTVLTNGAMNTSEGCSSISDANGNLLFYTSGTTIYDKSHAAMANGTGLLGTGSTSQSGVIVKQPGNANIYFVFSLDELGKPNGLTYSTVDMSLAAGMGSVTAKNVLIYTPTAEKITSARHCNGVDYWVITHDYLTDTFRANLVSSAGVNTVGVLSSVGSTYSGIIWTVGCMKSSPNGKKLCVNTQGAGGLVELYDFDTSTGIVSNPVSLGTVPAAYGCEFSPDGSKVYAGGWNNGPIYQWDLCAGTTSAVIASSLTVGTSTTSKGQFQLGNDGKIYIARLSKTYLSTISSPNTAGLACTFVDVGQSVAPKICNSGLTNFITSYLKAPLQPFTFSLSCNTATFSAPAVTNTVSAGCSGVISQPSSVLWSFGDAASGAANSSTLSSPTHTYPGAGNYSVELIYYNTCSNDTLRSVVTITNSAPSLSLTGALSICSGEKRIYTASGATSYTWHNGATTPSVALSPSVTTTFSFTGTSGGLCPAKKQFTVTVNKCTGLELAGEQDDRSFSIYPNPSSGMLFIELASAAKIKILDKSGELLVERWLERGKHSLDISSLSSGIYVVQCVTNKSVKTLRLVKSE